jgi:hypothetical protein
MSDKPSGKRPPRPLTRKVEARVSFQEFRKMRAWAGKERGGMSRLLRELIAEREAALAAKANAGGVSDNDGDATANDVGDSASLSSASSIPSDHRAAA